MTSEIIYSTVEEQVKKLKSQNLTIADEDFAAATLKWYGYSNLIKSYREPYVIDNGETKMYRDGVSFEQIASLYLFDKSLRNSVMSAMLDLEEHIKEISADVISATFGVHPDQYLQFRNYRSLRTHIPRFTLKGLLDTMHKTLETDKDPIHHYATEHGIVPPWILFKSIYFGTIINFIKHFKPAEQTKVARRLYGGDLGLSEQQLRYLMIDTLFIANRYRNLAAHGGRTYNYDCSNKFRAKEIFGDKAPSTKGFSLLLFLLSLLDYHRPFEILKNSLDEEINRHCQSFPSDVTYLTNVLHVNIESHSWVYVTRGSNKYHSNPHCSGIKNANKVEYEEALSHGYTPCKKCAR